MIKKTLYPKTERFKNDNNKIVITEKLDGSNLGIFKVDGDLIIAQRNNIYKFEELGNTNSYKGLKEWLDLHKDYLIENLIEGSGIFGEWIGMGKIKYEDKLDNIKFFIFAKANYNNEANEAIKINYTTEFFIYPFTNKIIPPFMGIVPIVAELENYPNSFVLNELYNEYLTNVDRPVEGFVINNNNVIKKYVRNKNGKIEEHREEYKENKKC